MHRVLAFVAALAVLGLAAAVVPPSPAGALAWSACPDDATAQCATVPVPVDWARPRGPSVDLALVRLPAADPASRIGSLVVNPGGPGISGVTWLLARHDLFSADLRRHFDLVSFDPRGVGRSHPVVCTYGLIQPAPEPVLTSQADVDHVVAHNRAVRDDCRARTGPLFDHVDTLSVVRDLDTIRAALGEDKLTYYGGSYGTLIGQQYAELFPDRIRALALDSNIDHSLGTAAFLRTQAVAAQDSFNEFVAWCTRDGACALHGRDVRAAWAELLARADRGALRDPSNRTTAVSPYDAVAFASTAFYAPDWAMLARAMAAAQQGAAPPGSPPGVTPGPGRSAKPGWSTTSRAAGSLPWVPTAPGREPVAAYAGTAIWCADWHLPIRDYREYSDLLRQSAVAAPDMRFAPSALALTVGCLGDPGPANGQHRLHATNQQKVLLVNAVHDPATGYVWATDVARQLGRGAQLSTYQGWGHGVYGRSPCIDSAVDAYLISQKLPPPGMSCPAVERTPEG